MAELAIDLGLATASRRGRRRAPDRGHPGDSGRRRCSTISISGWRPVADWPSWDPAAAVASPRCSHWRSPGWTSPTGVRSRSRGSGPPPVGSRAARSYPSATASSPGAPRSTSAGLAFENRGLPRRQARAQAQPLFARLGLAGAEEISGPPARGAQTAAGPGRGLSAAAVLERQAGVVERGAPGRRSRWGMSAQRRPNRVSTPLCRRQ